MKMPVTRNQASSTNGGDEDAFQRLLHTVASLQARSDEQSRLSEEAERRFRMAEERHQEALRRAQERAEELQQQLEAIKGARGREAPTQQETPQSFWGQPFSQEIDETRVPPNFREIMVEPFDGSQDPHAHLQAFQAQMYISGGDDKLSCKLFSGTLRGVAMQWIATLPPRMIQTFNDLADAFTSQFAANKKKQLEICHTRLLRFPPSFEGRMMGNNPTDWCEFHRTMGHSTEAFGRIVATVWADITTARKCYEDSLKIELDAQEDKGPYPVEDLKKVQIGTTTDQKTHIGTTLSEKEEELLVSTLQKNADVFAWTVKDMPGLDPRFMCHELSIKPGSKPIVQKKRKQGEEKRAAIKGEVEKLLAAGFVWEVQYPTWLANVVMVKKANGRWRMCTDYTDLNKACPKDPYPLPSIDRLVDGVSGQALLSFMDAYSGYNQIRMHPDDEEKTAFIIEAGAFCYKVMPFGLKNAGATYQRLMDKVFKEIIGKDMEVYVDDMVVKSSQTETHFHTLEQVFSILRKNRLRLNPEKCSFGVRAGKFLGFMLTKRGIEANPDKCQAVIDMRSP
ncbi:hypothetical protein CR513_42558, partial [Mucuna pruriens]